MVSVVSSIGGNFSFLRPLDANFVQKWQKCQICVIYENLECVSRTLPFWLIVHLPFSHQSLIVNTYFSSNPHRGFFDQCTLEENPWLGEEDMLGIGWLFDGKTRKKEVIFGYCWTSVDNAGKCDAWKWNGGGGEVKWSVTQASHYIPMDPERCCCPLSVEFRSYRVWRHGRRGIGLSCVSTCKNNNNFIHFRQIREYIVGHSRKRLLWGKVSVGVGEKFVLNLYFITGIR